MQNREMKKLLVVDDEKDTVEMITALLELEGYRVLPAFSGDEAMRILEAEIKRFRNRRRPSI